MEAQLPRKRRAIRGFNRTSQILLSPRSPSPFMEHVIQKPEGSDKTTEYRTQALLNLIHYANLMETFKQSINRFKGTNCPLIYRPDYNFTEKWEESSKTKIQKNENVYLSAQGVLFFLVLLVMLQKIPAIWHLSVYKVFRIQTQQWWFACCIIFGLVDMVLRGHLVYCEMFRNTSKEQTGTMSYRLRATSFFLGDVVTVVSYLTEIWLNEQGTWPQILLNYVVLSIQSKRFLDIYNSLVITLISYKYKNTVNLIGFLSKLFIVLHCCAIIMYTATLLSPINWLSSIGKDAADEVTKYIYSLYFTSTTMFTIGYGDIIPKNNTQIVVVLLIQILGIIAMGYIISEIGHTLSTIRQSRDDFEQDIQNADTICTNYQLNTELKNRVRNYIVNNQIANEQLNLKEENGVLMKLNEELRNQVNSINHLNIIKTSLFFIGHWSKKVQTELSKKLQKLVFSPNERISRLQKLYIVTSGHVDLYTEKKENGKVFCRKHLKTIYRDPKKEVFSNVIGCTSLYTHRISKLSALSKDFTICYALDYQDFLEVMKDQSKDFEFYHQTRSKLEQELFPERFEVPDLINNRQHYCPSRYLVLKRYNRQLKIMQVRQGAKRGKRRLKRTYFHEPEVPQSESDIESSDEEVDNDAEGNIRKTKHYVKLGEANQINSFGANNQCISFRSYRRRFLSKLDEERAKAKEMSDLLEHHMVQTSLFEIGKEYEKYFKHGNLSMILKRISKNQIKQMKEISSRNLQMDWIDLLIFAQKLHKEAKDIV